MDHKHSKICTFLKFPKIKKKNYDRDFLSLFDGANHNFRPFECSKNIFSDIGFVHSVWRVIDFNDLSNTETRYIGAWDKGGKISFSTWDPDSEHGINGDVHDSNSDHFVLDIFRVICSVDRFEAWEVFGEMLVREMFEYELFVVDWFLSVNGSHVNNV